MKVVSLLIFCSFPFLQAGGHGQSLVRVGAPSGEAQVTSVVIQQAGDVCFHGDSTGGNANSFFWDGESPFTEDFFDTGFSISPSWRNPGRDDLSSLAHSHHDLLRSPSQSHPLRC